MRLRPLAGLVAVLSVAATGCGMYASANHDGSGASSSAGPASVAAYATHTGHGRYAMPMPGALRRAVEEPDVLVVGTRPLSGRLRERIRALDDVDAVQALSVGSVPVGERSITVAGVDAASYRRFTPPNIAQNTEVWRRVAAGDATLTQQLGRDLGQPLGGTLALRSGGSEHALRIGVYTVTVPQIDAVVNTKRAEQLGMIRDNALLLSVPGGVAAVEAVVGKRAAVHRLSAPDAGQAAFLTGGSVAQAVGSFRYRYFPDGTVAPDPAWVAENIRTETVPILGRVTCHRVMLPQLRSALAEVVQRGLADRINAGDYGGCYVPRFIGRDARRGLSLHTWGIAVDLNVAGNQRGTVGEIDRNVVAILKRWGFAWGGDWSWTDPMHFELAALVR